MPKNNATNNLFLNQSVVQTATNYTALATDVIIEVTNTSAARTITLPAPSAAPSTSNVGKFYIIKDTSGGAGTNIITITPASGTIDGSANTSIQTNYGALQVFSDGTNYYTQGLWVNPSAYNPGTWFSYTPTITGLVLGSATLTSYYMQIGKVLFIQMSLKGGAGSSAGSGTYIWSLPTGFTINLSIAPVAILASPSTGFFPSLGNATAYLPNVTSGVGCGSPASATTYYLFISNPNHNAVSNVNYSFGSTSTFTANLQIPLV